MFVPKHHDGFCMFDTKTSDCNVMHTPFGRDYIKEISAARTKSDVRFCLYYSIMDWTNPVYHGNSGAYLTEYEKVMKTHLTELLTNYGPVGCMWFDGNWEGSWTHAYDRASMLSCAGFSRPCWWTIEPSPEPAAANPIVM